MAMYASNVEELTNLTNIFTGVTHNHPEGMKGALTISSCIYMALRGYKKEEREATKRMAQAEKRKKRQAVRPGDLLFIKDLPQGP